MTASLFGNVDIGEALKTANVLNWLYCMMQIISVKQFQKWHYVNSQPNLLRQHQKPDKLVEPRVSELHRAIHRIYKTIQNDPSFDLLSNTPRR